MYNVRNYSILHVMNAMHWPKHVVNNTKNEGIFNKIFQRTGVICFNYPYYCKLVHVKY